MVARKIRWDQFLAWSRVLLGLATLAVEVSGPAPLSFLFSMTVVVYVAFAALVATAGRGHSDLFGLLALFGDTLFFLIMANHMAASVLWLPSVYYLHLLAEAVAFYGPREVVTVAAVAAGFAALAPDPALRVLQNTLLVGGSVACAFSIHKRRMGARLAELERESKRTREEAQLARDAERQRIASDFHDVPLQSYISLQMRLEIVRKLLERDPAAGMQELQQLQSLTQSQLRDLRSFVRSMRPAEVDGSNLFAAARRIAESFEKESGIPVTFMGGSASLSAPPETCVEVLQLLREALHNVQKHAGATRVAVALDKVGNGLEMSVDDNGRGFSFSGTYNVEELELLRLGPASLKRRTRSLAAELALESRPGRGAGLKWRIPLQ